MMVKGISDVPRLYGAIRRSGSYNQLTREESAAKTKGGKGKEADPVGSDEREYERSSSKKKKDEKVQLTFKIVLYHNIHPPRASQVFDSSNML